MWWLIAGAVVVFVVLVAVVLPKIFFLGEYRLAFPLDRGTGHFEDESGRSIVYLPKGEYRAHIEQYILSNRFGKKVIICKINPKISYIDFDLVLFDRKRKVFTTLNIKEAITKSGFTQEVEIMPETAFASIVLNQADDAIFDNTTLKSPPLVRQFSLFSIITALTISLAFLVKVNVAREYGDVFEQGFLSSFGVNAATLIMSTLLSVIIFTIMLFRAKARRRDEL